MKLKKTKVHRPYECRCANCCQSEPELRAARLTQKQRLLPFSPQRVYSPWPKYKERRAAGERKRQWPGLFPARSRVRPASRVRRVHGAPRWQRMLPIIKATKAALAKP